MPQTHDLEMQMHMIKFLGGICLFYDMYCCCLVEHVLTYNNVAWRGNLTTGIEILEILRHCFSVLNT